MRWNQKTRFSIGDRHGNKCKNSLLLQKNWNTWYKCRFTRLVSAYGWLLIIWLVNRHFPFTQYFFPNTQLSDPQFSLYDLYILYCILPHNVSSKVNTHSSIRKHTRESCGTKDTQIAYCIWALLVRTIGDKSSCWVPKHLLDVVDIFQYVCLHLVQWMQDMTVILSHSVTV